MPTEIAAQDRPESQPAGDPDKRFESHKFYRRAAPLAGLRLARWRARRSVPLLVAVGVGMVAAVMLICTVPLYSSLVSTVQLQLQLSAQPPTTVNLEVDTNLRPASTESVGQVLDQDASSANQLLGRIAPTSTWYLRVDTDLPLHSINHTRLPSSQYALPQDPVLQPYVFNLPEALPHMRLIAGRLPVATTPGQMPEVLAVKELGLKPGDIVSAGNPSLAQKVVGVWTPKNVSDPYWNGQDFAPNPPPCVSRCSPIEYPVVFEQSTFFHLFGTAPGTINSIPFPVSVHYISFTEPRLITVAAVPGVIGAIATFRSSLNGTLYVIPGVTGTAVATQLDALLRGQEQQFALLAQPLYIVTAMLVGVTLLFVVAMSSLLVESQAGATATLTSRGASRTQILLNYGLNGLLVAIPAALAGPIFAAGLSLLIVRFFVPDSAAILQDEVRTNSAILAKIVSPQLVVQPALAGALLCLATVIVTAWTAARTDVLTWRRESGRQYREPLWQRWYLDLGLAALALAGYLELGEFGGLNIRQQLGQGTTSGGDLIQLAAPSLLLLAGALLALRLFPLATRVGAWLASTARGATAMLALAQLDRERGHFARVALLLALAVGLGVFALTFQASLHTNTQADAQFLVGSDQRVMMEGPDQGVPATAPLQSQIATLPGVTAITPVYRSAAYTAVDNTSVGLLGIDPSNFGTVAYWRSDFANEPLSRLLSRMQAHAQGALAGDPGHPIWALIDPQFAANYNLAPNVVFVLNPADDPSVPLYFVVEAVVPHFPTLTDNSQSGQIVFNLADYANAVTSMQRTGSYVGYIGPNEYWLRTSKDASAATRRAEALQNPNLYVQSVTSLSAVEQQATDDPLTSGMTGLLELGAAVVAVLSVLGTVIAASVAARQRSTQLAVLRTLGGSQSQLAGIHVTQQAVVYSFGLIAGTVLGVLLATATLPFLQFSTAVLNLTADVLPPFLLSFNVVALAVFYAAVLLAFALALVASLQIAQRGGLGRAIRLGED